MKPLHTYRVVIGETLTVLGFSGMNFGLWMQWSHSMIVGLVAFDLTFWFGVLMSYIGHRIQHDIENMKEK